MTSDISPVFTKILLPMATNQDIDDFCKFAACNEEVPRMDIAVFMLALLRRLQIAENVEKASPEARKAFAKIARTGLPHEDAA